MGAGAALALTAAVLYGVGVSKGDSAYEDYEAAKTQQERDTHYEDVQSAEGMIIGGHVMAGLAVAAVGVGVWALLTRPSADEELKAGVQSAPAAVLGFTPHGERSSLLTASSEDETNEHQDDQHHAKRLLLYCRS